MNSLSKIMVGQQVHKDRERKTFYVSGSIYRKYKKAVKKNRQAKSVSATIENFMTEAVEQAQ